MKINILGEYWLLLYVLQLLSEKIWVKGLRSRTILSRYFSSKYVLESVSLSYLEFSSSHFSPNLLFNRMGGEKHYFHFLGQYIDMA